MCDATRDSELFAPEKMGKLIGAGLQKQNIVGTLATHGGETWPLVGALSWIHRGNLPYGRKSLS